MNRDEAIAAAKELEAAPAARWVGTGVRPDGRAVIHRCIRCEAEETLELPVPANLIAANPALAPPGHDDRVFAWARAFLIKHAGCKETQGASK